MSRVQASRDGAVELVGAGSRRRTRPRNRQSTEPPNLVAAIGVTGRPAAGHSVHVVAEVGGERREGEAWFEVDNDRQHLRWGAEGESNYHGELDVTADATGSTVTVTLHTEHADVPGIDGSDGAFRDPPGPG